MSVDVKFQVLYGEGEDDPQAYLLNVDGVSILLDCGWDDAFLPATIAALKPVIPTVDIVLLSHPDLEHVGALPYAVSKLGLRARILCTYPVHKMGQMFLYDAYLSRTETGRVRDFTLDDVDLAFKVLEQGGMVEQLRYLQEVTVKGIKFSPHRAGRMIGGALWKITKGLEEVVYAVDFNHRDERHMNKTVLGTLRKPSVLITDARNAMTQAPRQRKNELLDHIVQFTRMGGNVLLPTDAAGRMLELALLLDSEWRPGFGTLVLLNRVGDATIDYAKTLVEWMGDAVNQHFTATRSSPYSFSHVKIVAFMEDLASLPPPYVVLTPCSSMETGFAKQLFMQWAPEPRNGVVLTERSRLSSLARRLFTVRPGDVVDVEVTSLAPVTDAALAADMRRSAELKQAVLEEAEDLAVGGLGEGDAEDDGDDPMGGVVAPSTPGAGAEAGAAPPTPIIARPKPFLFKVRYPMFSSFEPRPTITPYGEELDLATFAIGSGSAGVDDTLGSGLPDGERTMAVPVAAVSAADAAAASEVAERAKLPMKVTRSTVRVAVNCRVEFIEMEGRTDGRSIVNLVEGITPRTAVLVHGTPEAKAHLAKACKDTVVASVSPAAGEPVTVSSHTAVVQTQLESTLFDGLEFQSVAAAGGGSFDVAYMHGSWKPGRMASGLTLHPVDGLAPPHDPVLLRSQPLRLHEVRRKLRAMRVKSEFVGFVLVTTQGVRVSKSDTQVHVDGPLCDDYFAVREVLAKLYTMV